MCVIHNWMGGILGLNVLVGTLEDMRISDKSSVEFHKS